MNFPNIKVKLMDIYMALTFNFYYKIITLLTVITVC